MSILSTNHRLVSIGESYSAGNGIDITDQVISVTGDVTPYSAGENIDIQDHIISGKDWSNDITEASSNAYNETTAWVKENYANSADMTYISAVVDTKLDASAWSSVSGDLATESYVIMSDNITYDRAKGYVDSKGYATEEFVNENTSGKLDSTAFSTVSGTFLTADNTVMLEYGTSTWAEFKSAYDSHKNIVMYKRDTGDIINQYATFGCAIFDETPYEASFTTVCLGTEYRFTLNSNNVWKSYSQMYQYRGNYYSASNPSGFITGVSIPESATWNEVSTTVQTNSAQWAEGGAGDEEVNSFVYNNSATINEVNTTYQANSGSYQPSGNYIPYTAVDPVFNSFVTNSGLEIETNTAAGALSNTYINDSYISLSFINSNLDINNRLVLSYGSLNFKTNSDSAYLDREKIHTWDSASNYIQSNSANWNDVSTTVQSNSAQWGQGGGAISSYTTVWSHDVPPYGDSVINTLNEKYISAFISNSADKSNFANNANSANSANYAETVNETYLENKGFTRNLSSEYGTISVIHNNIIESTNSAIVRTGNEGFVSAFDGASIGPEVGGIATYSWDKTSPNTTINLIMAWTNNQILTYSANTNLTGEIVLPMGENTQTINIPNATEFKVSSNNWIGINSAVVSAADQFETTVGELAWASALPTYEYDNTNKISAINGSALAGGGDVPSGTMNVSGLEYNAVNEISAYNGSAIAQYGAEKQWLVHDDTLVHVANSAQYALGVNVSALQRLMGIDETVLFESTSTSGSPMTDTFNLSGSMADYEKIKILYRPWNDSIIPEWFEFDYNKRGNSNIMRRSTTFTINPLRFIVCEFNFSADNSFVVNDVRFADSSFTTTTLDKSRGDIWKVIGIGRKA